MFCMFQWVWYVHMLAPEAYSRDCQNAVDKLVDHAFPEGPEALNRFVSLSRQFNNFICTELKST